jgi:hypothetical protein
MRCERAQELFSEYNEGNIQTALRVPLEDHLSTCDSCRTEMEGLRKIWTMLDTAPVIEPPADFRAVVWRRIDADLAAKGKASQKPAFSFNWRSLFTRPALGWATAVLAIVALAPVVVPGPQTAARMWFPWSLFYHGKPASSAQVNISIGQPKVVSQGGHVWLDVPVNNPGTVPARVSATITSGTVENKNVEIESPAGTNAWFHVTTIVPSTTEPVRGRLTWEQNGSTQTKEFTLSPQAQ